MSKTFLDTTPPVLAALNAGSPVVAIETGSFARLPYPQSLQTLRASEQEIWARNCVPAPLALINGRIKAGLTEKEEEALMQHDVALTRAALPVVTARGRSGALLPSAALAAAAAAGIVPLLLPGFRGEVSDVDALALYGRMAFSFAQTEDVGALLAERNIPALGDNAAVLSDAYLCQKELSSPESVLYAAGKSLTTLCEIACATAVEIKKKTDFQAL